MQSIEAIRFTDAVILVLDATLSISKQDLRIANLALDEGRIIIIAVNKWDLIKPKDQEQSIDYYSRQISIHLPQILEIPIVYVSAETKYNIYKILDKIFKIKQSCN